MDNQQDKEIWIFLSHSNKDFAKVWLIRNYLEEHSCRPLMFYLKCLSNDDEIDELNKREIDCRTRFYQKELDLFETTLRIKLNETFIAEKVRSYYPKKSEAEQLSMIQQIEYIVNNHLYIERYS